LASPMNVTDTIGPFAEGLIVSPGHSVSTTVQYKSWNGFSAPVQLSCPATIAPGLSCSFDKTTLGPGDTATMTVIADATAEIGQLRFPVAGAATVNGVAV